MSTEINDGGPAFPLATSCGSNTAVNGMTLRDWFAGQAIAAIPHIGCGADLSNYELAQAAYQIADAMIAARNTSTPTT